MRTTSYLADGADAMFAAAVLDIGGDLIAVVPAENYRAGLIAVWDGQPAAGFGGTADVVAYARNHDIVVTVVWPDGAERGR